MLYIETEFYTKKIGLKEMLQAFLLVLFLLYSVTLTMYIYSMSAYSYFKVQEKIKEQEVQLRALDARNAELHDEILRMLDEKSSNN